MNKIKKAEKMDNEYITCLEIKEDSIEYVQNRLNSFLIKNDNLYLFDIKFIGKDKMPYHAGIGFVYHAFFKRKEK